MAAPTPETSLLPPEQTQTPEDKRHDGLKAVITAAAIVVTPTIIYIMTGSVEAATGAIIPGTLAAIGARGIPKAVERLTGRVEEGLMAASIRRNVGSAVRDRERRRAQRQKAQAIGDQRQQKADERAQKNEAQQEAQQQRRLSKEWPQLERSLKRLPLAEAHLSSMIQAALDQTATETAAMVRELEVNPKEKALAKMQQQIEAQSIPTDTSVRDSLVYALTKWQAAGLNLSQNPRLEANIRKSLEEANFKSTGWHANLLEQLFKYASQQRVLDMNDPENIEWANWVRDRQRSQSGKQKDRR